MQDFDLSKILLEVIQLLFLFIGPLFIILQFWWIKRHPIWQQLVREYPAPPEVKGKIWRRAFIRLDQGNEWSQVNPRVVANSEGVLFHLAWFLLPWRIRVFIPWQEFHDATLIAPSWLWMRQVLAKVGEPPVTIRLPGAIFQETEGRNVLVKTVDYLI